GRWLSRRACNLSLKIGDLSRDFNHVRMIGCVERLQRLFLCNQSPELSLALIHCGCCRRLRALKIARLLGNHSLEESHILLLAIQRLSNSVKLGCKRLERVRVGLLLVGEPAEIPLLKSCELGVLLVKVPL